MLPPALARFVPPQTPALVVDVARLDANIAVMQAACDAAKVRLRAHGKMHKCPAIAQRQIAAGAVGLCCQTIGEAEAFARAGIGDLLITAPLPRWAVARLVALARETGAQLAAVVDSAAQIARLDAAAMAAGVTLGALVDVDIDMHRAGAVPRDVPMLAAALAGARALRYDGIQAYFGHIQHMSEGRAAALAKATQTLADLRQTLTDGGYPPAQISGGGTGTYALDLNGGIYTELQCGSYALMDAEYLDCGGPVGDWPFAPALFLAATVVSAQHASHVTIDAGLKALSADVPPRIAAGGVQGSHYRSMGDEHGAVVGRGARMEGDLVWLQPGHCDPTINLHDALWAVQDDGAVERWAISARRVTPAG